MPNPFNLTISDTSPIFQYFPSRDGPINSSWNASFSGSPDSTWVPQGLGVGTSAHRTTLPDASVRLDWIGTAIYLYGEATVGAYTILLDGSTADLGTSAPGLLFSKSGLTYGAHTLTLRVVQGTSTTSISNAIITVGMGEAGTTIQNRTIDTLSVPLTRDGIVLAGTWFEYRTTYGIGGPFVPRLATNVAGSSISFPISSASAFYIVGHVNFDHGPYIVDFTPPPELGPRITYQYNASSRWVGLNTIKFLATELDRTRTYQVRLVNDANSFYDQSQIIIIDTPPDRLNTINPGSSNNNGQKSLSGGAIAGIVIGSLLLLTLLILVLWKRRQSWSYFCYAIARPVPPPIIPEFLLPNPGIPIVNPQQRDSGLSVDEARFFNNLFALNVPAEQIMTMMETLRNEREVANRNSDGDIRVHVAETVPQYDIKDRP